jgi:hypothetical protein
MHTIKDTTKRADAASQAAGGSSCRRRRSDALSHGKVTYGLGNKIEGAPHLVGHAIQ